MKFKVGDRVRVIEQYGEAPKGSLGTIKLIGLSAFGVEFDKRHGNDFHSCGGHIKDRRGYWIPYGFLELIDTTDDNKIVVTHNGKSTIATLYDGKKVVKRTEAKCHPDDEFDFMVGAKLAVERLTHHEPKFKVGDTVIAKKSVFNVPIPTGLVCKIEDVFHVGSVCIYGVKDEEGDHWLTVEERITAYVKPKYFTGKVVCVKSNGNAFKKGKVYGVNNGELVGNHCRVKRCTSVCRINHMFDGVYEFIELVEG